MLLRWTVEQVTKRHSAQDKHLDKLLCVLPPPKKWLITSERTNRSAGTFFLISGRAVSIGRSCTSAICTQADRAAPAVLGRSLIPRAPASHPQGFSVTETPWNVLCPHTASTAVPMSNWSFSVPPAESSAREDPRGQDRQLQCLPAQQTQRPAERSPRADGECRTPSLLLPPSRLPSLPIATQIIHCSMAFAP